MFFLVNNLIFINGSAAKYISKLEINESQIPLTILVQITCSDSKAILSGSNNISQNNLELHELQNPTQSFILEKLDKK